MILFKLLIGLGIPFGVGCLILRALFPSRELPSTVHCALAWGAGWGAVAAGMFVIGWPGVRYSLATVSLPVVFLGIVSAVVIKTKRGTAVPAPSVFYAGEAGNPSRVTNFLSSLMLAYVLYHVIFVFGRTLMIPVYVWDAVATSSFKAKILFFEGDLSLARHFPHPEYPLLIPMAQTWVSFFLGAWDEQLVKSIFPGFFVSYLLMQYAFVRAWASRFWALLGLVLVVSANQLVAFATVAYRDFPILYYNCMTIMLLLLWERKQNRGYLIVAGIFSGLAIFTKLEGIGYFGIHAVLTVFILWKDAARSWQARGRDLFLFLLMSVPVWLAHVLFKASLGIAGSGRFVFDLSSAGGERLMRIINAFTQMVFLSGNWNILWFLLVVSLLWFPRRKHSAPVQGLTLSLFLFWGIYSLVAWLTPNFISVAGEESVDVLPRVILHIVPLVSLLIIFLNMEEDIRHEG